MLTPPYSRLLDRFDIIGVDLRGTGLSDPIVCVRHIINQPQDEWYPSTDAAYDQLLKRNQALRRSCLQMNGPIIYHMDTISISNDFEAVRKALGEEGLTWIGTSYGLLSIDQGECRPMRLTIVSGTQLATQYAELFPDNIRAMVLDGCVSLSASEMSIFAEGAADSDAVLGSFFNWCEQQNATTCPLINYNQSVESIWIDLMSRSSKWSRIDLGVAETHIFMHRSNSRTQQSRLPSRHLSAINTQGFVSDLLQQQTTSAQPSPPSFTTS